MLKKVFKYDFTALFREMMPLLIAGIAVDMLIGLATRDQTGLMLGIAMLAYICVAVAIGVVLFIRQIHHFYDDVYGNNSYFMMTLPVKEEEAILGRLLSAFVMELIEIAICAIPLVLLMGQIPNLEYLGLSGSLVVMAIITTVLAVLCNILMLYLSIAVGMLVPHYHTVISIICYVVFAALIIWISMHFIGSYGVEVMIQQEEVSAVVSNNPELKMFGCVAAIHIIAGVLSYGITRWLMKTHLNINS